MSSDQEATGVPGRVRTSSTERALAAGGGRTSTDGCRRPSPRRRSGCRTLENLVRVPVRLRRTERLPQRSDARHTPHSRASAEARARGIGSASVAGRSSPFPRLGLELTNRIGAVSRCPTHVDRRVVLTLPPTPTGLEVRDVLPLVLDDLLAGRVVAVPLDVHPHPRTAGDLQQQVARRKPELGRRCLVARHPSDPDAAIIVVQRSPVRQAALVVGCLTALGGPRHVAALSFPWGHRPRSDSLGRARPGMSTLARAVTPVTVSKRFPTPSVANNLQARAKRKPAVSSGFLDGARRARTADLLGAIQIRDGSLLITPVIRKSN